MRKRLRRGKHILDKVVRARMTPWQRLSIDMMSRVKHNVIIDLPNGLGKTRTNEMLCAIHHPYTKPAETITLRVLKQRGRVDHELNASEFLDIKSVIMDEAHHVVSDEQMQRYRNIAKGKCNG